MLMGHALIRVLSSALKPYIEFNKFQESIFRWTKTVQICFGFPCPSSVKNGKFRLKGDPSGSLVLMLRQDNLNYFIFDPVMYFSFKTCLEF